MADVITGPEVKEFNPAALVYKDDNGDKVLNLDAKMAWFHHLKPGWRITIDGLRVFGMEVYVNNTYEMPDEPGKFFSRREKEIVYQAVGFISMLDSKSVRVASVPMNIDASDPDFCGKLFEDGAEFLLDVCGFNVYNITKEQWEAAMESRVQAHRDLRQAVQQAPAQDQGYDDYNYNDQQEMSPAEQPYTDQNDPNDFFSNLGTGGIQTPDEQKQDQFFDGLFPNTPPSIDAQGDPSSFDFNNAFQNMEHATVIPSDPEDEDELSVNSIMKLFEKYNSLLSKPMASELLPEAFKKYISACGDIYTELDTANKMALQKDLKGKIRDLVDKL